MKGSTRRARRRLRVACAIDRDIERQVGSGTPVLDRAHGAHDVYLALRRSFDDVRLVPVCEDLERTLGSLHDVSPDVTFNLARPATSNEPCFAGALEYEGFAFTGSGPLGIALSRDKVRSRQLISLAGVDVPAFVEIRVGERPDLGRLRPPLLVKPAYLGGCSRGIHARSVVGTRAAAYPLARQIWATFGDSAVCDEFIVGRDLRVGALSDGKGQFRVIGITESCFRKAPPGWGFKTNAIRMNPRVRSAQCVESVVPTLSMALRRRIAEVAQTCASTLALRGYLTLDLRIDEQGRCVVIEVNANPGLSRQSLIWGRPSLTHNVGRIVEVAAHSS